MSSFAGIFAGFDSSHLEHAVADKKFDPVKPVKRELGSSEMEFQTASGCKSLKQAEDVIDIPILQQIQQILCFPEVQEDLAKQRPEPKPGQYADVSDGLLWKRHELGSKNPVRLSLYNDALEYCEAIGAFRSKKKAEHFYLTILNLSPEIRMKSNYMILASSCFATTMKKHGVATIVSGKKVKCSSSEVHGGVNYRQWQQGSDLGSFFRNAWLGNCVFDFGRHVHESTKLGPQPRPVILQQSTGDRLAVHAALRCKEGVGPATKRICHQCTCGGHEMHEVQDFLAEVQSPFSLRSSAKHNHNLNEVNTKRACNDPSWKETSMFYGVNDGDHMYAGIPGFRDILVEGTPGYHRWHYVPF